MPPFERFRRYGFTPPQIVPLAVGLLAVLFGLLAEVLGVEEATAVFLGISMGSLFSWFVHVVLTLQFSSNEGSAVPRLRHIHFVNDTEKDAERIVTKKTNGDTPPPPPPCPEIPRVPAKTDDCISRDYDHAFYYDARTFEIEFDILSHRPLHYSFRVPAPEELTYGPNEFVDSLWMYICEGPGQEEIIVCTSLVYGWDDGDLTVSRPLIRHLMPIPEID